MPRKRSTKRERFTDWKNLNWVLNNLSEEQLGMVDSLPFDMARFAEWLDDRIESDGMEFKFSWDTYSETWQAQLIGAWKGFPNA